MRKRVIHEEECRAIEDTPVVDPGVEDKLLPPLAKNGELTT